MQWTNIEMPQKYDREPLGPMASKNCRCLDRILENGTDATGSYLVLNVPGSQDLVVFLTIKTPVLVLVSRFAGFGICWIHRISQARAR